MRYKYEIFVIKNKEPFGETEAVSLKQAWNQLRYKCLHENKFQGIIKPNSTPEDFRWRITPLPEPLKIKTRIPWYQEKDNEFTEADRKALLSH